VGAAAIKLHQGGKAQSAVATNKRIPTCPTFRRSMKSAKGFESHMERDRSPPNTPPAIVAKLNKAVNEVLKSPEVQDHFAKINLHPAGGSPTEAKAFIRKETEVWGRVIKDAHVEAH
jgi:tripartite-type tricarboxylate transporter receptor subunit TctC